MSFDYSRAATSSLRLLERYGRKALLRRTKTGEYDPATGKTSQKSVDHEAICVFLGYQQRDIDGTVIRAGDQRVLMAPNAPRPITGDAVVIDDQVLGVVAVEVVEPAGVALLYKIQVRG